MCCEGRSAKDAFTPTGTWVDRTTQDTFTAEQVAEAEGCATRTIQRLVDLGAFGPLVYWVGGSVRIPRLAVMHFHARSRTTRRGRKP